MTCKERDIILDRLNKLQSTIDYNMNLYRQTGEDLYNTRADMYRAMLFGVRGVTLEIRLIGED